MRPSSSLHWIVRVYAPGGRPELEDSLLASCADIGEPFDTLRLDTIDNHGNYSLLEGRIDFLASASHARESKKDGSK